MSNLVGARHTRYDRLRALLSAARAEPRVLRGDMAGAPLLLALFGVRVELAHARVGRDWLEVGMDLVEDVERALEELRESLDLVAPLLTPARYARSLRRVERLLRRVRRRRTYDVAIREIRAREERSEGTIEATQLLHTLKRKQQRASTKLQRRSPPLRLLRHARQLLELASEPADATRPLDALAPDHLERRIERVERRLAHLDHPKDLRGHRSLGMAVHRLAVAVKVLGEAYPKLWAEPLATSLAELDSAMSELGAARRLLRVAKKHGHKVRGASHLERALAREAKEKARAARVLVVERCPKLLTDLRAAIAR